MMTNCEHGDGKHVEHLKTVCSELVAPRGPYGIAVIIATYPCPSEDEIHVVGIVGSDKQATEYDLRCVITRLLMTAMSLKGILTGDDTAKICTKAINAQAPTV